jgi:hypothetical protein
LFVDALHAGGTSDDGETVTIWAAERQRIIPGCLNQATALEGHVEKELGVVLP